MDMMKKTSLKDIAQHLNCSLITVSRALNGREDDPHVSPELRKKIRSAAEELHYVRSRSARTLRLGKSKSIGLVSTCLCGHFHSCNIDAFFKESLNRGYQFKIVLTKYDKEQEENALKELLQEQPDAVLYQPFLDCSSPVSQFLEKQNFPMLLLGGASENNHFNSIQFDQESFWDDIFQTFVERGHKEVAVQAELSDEMLHFYSKKYDLSLERMLQRGATRKMLDENHERMAQRKVKALVSMHSQDTQTYFNYLQQRRLPCPDAIGVYGIPGELVLHENYLGAVVSDLHEYVELCFDKLIAAINEPDTPPQNYILPRRFFPVDELKKLQKQQMEDPWYALYTT